MLRGYICGENGDKRSFIDSKVNLLLELNKICKLIF